METALDTSSKLTGRAFGTRIVVLAYLFAMAAAWISVGAGAEGSPLVATLWADVAATVAVFAFSLAFRNSSFYDAYWSVAPIAIGLYWASLPAGDAPVLRQALALGCVTIWGGRLTYNWWRGWTGLDHEDWRYRDLQEKCGAFYWPVSFAGIHMFPTLIVFAGCLTLWPALHAGAHPIGWLDAAALIVTAGAIWIEARADAQLVRFRASSPAPGDLLMSGLWATSRHPNYFGEIAFWWGLGLFGFAASPGAWWVFAGPLAITLMFQFVSLPMLENHMLQRRPHYADVIKQTSKLVPWPPR
jgi:steroid 5-alpha reductase family enzyme